MVKCTHIWLIIVILCSVSDVIILGKKGEINYQNLAQILNAIVLIGIDLEREYLKELF
jgi:hypothetical protein